MSVNWATYDFSPASCLPCCEEPVPADCACALLIPELPGSGVTSPYADYTTAETAIADYVVDCLVYNYYSGFVAYDTYTVSTASGISVSATKNPGGDAVAWVSVSLKAASTLTFSYNVINTGVSPTCLRVSSSVFVYTCSGDLVDSFETGEIEDSTTGTYGVSISTDGTYYVLMTGAAYLFSGCEEVDPEPTTALDATLGITSDDTMVVNPVIALWDDSGTTRQLEACPKMLLPLGTEVTGDWYADEAEAQAVIDDYTSNCIGWTAAIAGIGAGYYDAFTWSISGTTSVAVSTSATESDTNSVGGITTLAFSINAEAGETISWPWTFSASGQPGTGVGGGVSMSIASYAGASVEAFDYPITDEDTSASDTFTSAPLPYTGRYIISIGVLGTFSPDGIGGDATFGVTGTLTSSGALSVNPIQALWDIGLTCPARLDC
jgi:hypothetical protein